MIVYVPTPITSVEQAESLPIGTVSIADHPDDKPAVKVTPTLWVCVWDVDDDHDATYDVASHGHMVGSVALVPVEAKEETTVPFQGPVGVMHVGFGSGSFDTPHARLTTPWERIDGPSPDRRGDCA